MKMFIVGIFDRKAQAFITFTVTPNVNVAAREFSEAVMSKTDNPISKWPEDHELYELGVWDSETGRCEAREDDGNGYWEKKLIIDGATLKTLRN